jgi:hypothetical protein
MIDRPFVEVHQSEACVGGREEGINDDRAPEAFSGAFGPHRTDMAITLIGTRAVPKVPETTPVQSPCAKLLEIAADDATANRRTRFAGRPFSGPISRRPPERRHSVRIGECASGPRIRRKSRTH